MIISVFCEVKHNMICLKHVNTKKNTKKNTLFCSERKLRRKLRHSLESCDVTSRSSTQQVTIKSAEDCPKPQQQQQSRNHRKGCCGVKEKAPVR